jgi:hypothetical protein
MNGLLELPVFSCGFSRKSRALLNEFLLTEKRLENRLIESKRLLSTLAGQTSWDVAIAHMEMLKR